MFRYAQLDKKNIVGGISFLSGKVTADNMVLINDKEVELGSTYDKTTNTFIPPIIVPDEPQHTIEEIAEENLLETKYQTLLLEMML